MTMDESTHPDSHPEARLRAADPAGPDPDLSALQARVLGALAEQAAAEPSRTSAPWLRLVAAAGAVIALGAAGLAGYAIGQRPSNATIVASSAVDAVAPSFGPSAAAPLVESTDSAKAADVPASEPAALTPAQPSVSSMTSMMWPGWTTAWQASPALADSPSVATGYALSTADLDREALATELASTLAVTGDVEPDGAGGYRAGPVDGTGPALGVGGDAMATWSYVDPAVQPADGAAPIEPDAAQQQARALLRSVGVPVRAVDWQIEPVGSLTAVTAWQLVSGVRTQLQWSVLVAPDGSIASASGFAAGLAPIPGYEVVGAATAVRRLAQPGWSALSPVPLAGASVTVAPTEAASGAPAPVPSANGRPVVTATVAFVTVTDSELGLAPYWQPDGTVLVLPSYVIADRDGRQWSLIGVADRYVRFVAPDPGAPMPLAAR